MQPTDKELIAAEDPEPVQHQSTQEGPTKSEELAHSKEEVLCLCPEHQSSPEFAQEVGPVKPEKLVSNSFERNGQPLDAVQRLVDQS